MNRAFFGRKKEKPGNCGNPGQATVAAFRPWRDSLAGIPQSLAAGI